MVGSDVGRRARAQRGRGWSVAARTQHAVNPIPIGSDVSRSVTVRYDAEVFFEALDGRL